AMLSGRGDGETGRRGDGETRGRGAQRTPPHHLTTSLSASPRLRVSASPRLPVPPSLSPSEAIRRARARLPAPQQPEGHWVGELEGDTILESEYLLLLQFMGWTDAERFRRAAAYLRAKQLPEGGWAIYPGGPPELSASIKAYLVLKWAGADPEEPEMAR